jgi:hypothetical chaperone protein
MTAACGIDFGTSNSAVALPTGEVLRIAPPPRGQRLFRSVLFFPEQSREALAGASAIEEYLQRGEGRFIQSVKSWLPSASFSSTVIRGRAFRLEELVAILLRAIRTAGELAAGTPLPHVVLGRPARFGDDAESDARAERRLRTAAELAGFTDIRFVIEPIAAALAYEATLTRDELVLVADFGAGTSDLTLMHLGPSRRARSDRQADIVASSGVAIGGDRFDAAIMKHKLLRYFGERSTYEVMGKRLPMPAHIMQRLLAWHEMSFIREQKTRELLDRMLHSGDDVPAIEALQDLVEENLGFRLYRAIEAAKIRLSETEATRVGFDEARIHIDEPLTRADFERFAAPLLDALDACVAELLQSSGVATRDLSAIFLTGGSSQIPAVRRLFARRFGPERLRSADAFTSVAEGLGRAAGGARFS